MNASRLVLQAGFTGQLIGNGLGLFSTQSGGNSRAAGETASLKPSNVGSLQDIFQSVTYGSDEFSAKMSTTEKEIFVKATADLHNLQKSGYDRFSNGEMLSDLSTETLQFVEGLVGDIGALDPRRNEAVRDVYGIAEDESTDSQEALSAALSFNTIEKLSGPSVWTLGGCDYHDGGFATGDQKDEEMGRQIGRALELARRLGKPFFFQLITDGGCVAVEGSRNWQSDAGVKSMTVLGYMNPAGKPNMRKFQVGHYTNGQGAASDILVNSPIRASYASFANYLHVNGKLDLFNQLLPGVFTNAGELDSVLLFE